MNAADRITTTCAIAGGGPAGMMLGLLLARAGIGVVVLEKHADFLRDFRGDTLHPSTLEVMHELGRLEALLERPHQRVTTLAAVVGSETVQVADFSHLPTRCKFIALMPQWEFLDFLADEGRRYPGFRLLMRAEVTDLIVDHDRVVGLRAETPDGPLDVRAELTIGADGRRSTVRAKAGLTIDTLGAPIDVLWFSLPRRESDGEQSLGRMNAGHIFIMLNRGDYWQCAFVIAKGAFDATRRAGLPALREDLARVAPLLRDRVQELQSWDDIKLLTVAVDRLRQWHRPGLLCIGDAAHAMSPIGGVGINLAIQDAVAAANILAEPLRAGTLAPAHLESVQRRRAFPTRVTQRAQILVQDNIIRRVLKSRGTIRLPWALWLLNRYPVLRRLPARMVGLGVRPEHVATRALAPLT